MTNLTITGLTANTFQDIRQDVAGILDDELVELGVIIERDSPKGVSDTGSSLSSTWDIRPATLSAQGIQASVFNPLPFSLERLAGRGPGKPPPISKIARWARAKGISPYAVARKIGKEGTERWKEGEDGNILKINPRTKEIPVDKGPQKATTDNIVRRIEGLRY